VPRAIKPRRGGENLWTFQDPPGPRLLTPLITGRQMGRSERSQALALALGLGVLAGLVQHTHGFVPSAAPRTQATQTPRSPVVPFAGECSGAGGRWWHCAAGLGFDAHPTAARSSTDPPSHWPLLTHTPLPRSIAGVVGDHPSDGRAPPDGRGYQAHRCVCVCFCACMRAYVCIRA
jgi:hypothetical protein